MSPRPLLHLLLALVIATGVLCPSSARADGDPASDVLVTQNLFVPVDAGFSDAQRARLTGALSAAERDHFPIRVAIIPAAFDLGAVTEFWSKPASYAHFLGIELSLVYKGPLLVVMPNGFGLSWPEHSTASVEHLLSKIRLEPTGAGLLTAVQTAIRELAASAKLSGKTTVAVETNGGSGGLTLLIAVAVAAIVALSAASFVLRQRRRRQTHPSKSASASPRIVTSWLGWAVPVLVLLLAVAAIVHSLASRGQPRLPLGEKITENSPSIFPLHQKRAPKLLLRDQNGRPVSLAAYRGRSVIVTFIDPLSREPYPRTVQILNQAEAALRTSQRPEILAVSVDVYGDARTILLRDFHRWHLGPQWRLVVGSPGQLASVWKHYYVVVDVISRKVAGATVRDITQSKMAYLIDGSGYERALFGWPYGVHEVDRTLQLPARFLRAAGTAAD